MGAPAGRCDGQRETREGERGYSDAQDRKIMMGRAGV